MQIALCNEVIAGMEFGRQCEFAAILGYDGLEVAPFTLGEEPHLLPAARRAEVRRAAADAGIAITGLHWLLVKPAGLSITAADPAQRARTLDVMRRHVDLCAELGGSVLVHGSPAQRRVPEGEERAEARKRGADAFAAIAENAEKAGVTYCIEALAPPEANFITSIAEAAAIVRAIGSPAVRTMLDCSAAGKAERESIPELLRRWLPTGLLAHIQVNDRNRRGPGQGEERFAPIFATLRELGYDRCVAVEPFDYQPDGPATAARAIGYIRGILESLS
ncbi:MAG: sugar phosphate isomerase/epimerase [Alphaproteobacteria bacterium]|nr:sugar phosphate isomerase/epimerase [Alphaproteobacteria bacterium]